MKWLKKLSTYITEPRITKDYRLFSPKVEIEAIARFISINDMDKELNNIKNRLREHYDYTDIRQSITIGTTGTNIESESFDLQIL